jgi:hypothetical protein
VGELSLFERRVELVDQRHDWAAVRHGEKQVIWLGIDFAAKHSLQKLRRASTRHDFPLPCLPINQETIVTPSKLVLERHKVPNLQRVGFAHTQSAVRKNEYVVTQQAVLSPYQSPF